MNDFLLKLDRVDDNSLLFEQEPGADSSAASFLASAQRDKFMSASTIDAASSGEGNHDKRFALKKPIQFDKKEFSIISTSTDDQMNDLFEGTVSLVNKCMEQDPDTIFFLDKSARPAAYLFRETWRKLLPSEKLPNIRFINIGRKDQKEDENTINELRNRLSGIEEDKILVVDEYVETGKTLDKAVSTIGRLFPKAKSVTGTEIFKDQPFWFDAPEFIGVDESSEISPDYIAIPSRKGDEWYPGQRSELFLGLREDLSKISSIISNNTIQTG